MHPYASYALCVILKMFFVFGDASLDAHKGNITLKYFGNVSSEQFGG